MHKELRAPCSPVTHAAGLASTEGSRRWHVRRWGAVLALICAVSVTPAVNAAGIPPDQQYSLRDVNTQHQALALTFDISWGTVMPPKVFHILVHDHVPATIFVSGPWAEQHAALVRAFHQAGMEVESHGWTHVNYSSLSVGGIQANLSRAGTVIEHITGVRPTFVRPPNGDFDRRSLRVTRDSGYTTVTWGTDSLDWMNPGVGHIIDRVLQRAHPGDIVLLHASDTCKQTDLALPTIIRQLRRRGYALVTLGNLLKLGTPIYRG